MQTVRLHDVLQPVPRGAVTTAHIRINAFYFRPGSGVLTGFHRESLRERLARAASPFAIDGILADARLHGLDRSPKLWARLEATAEQRRCELRGWLYVREAA